MTLKPQLSWTTPAVPSGGLSSCAAHPRSKQSMGWGNNDVARNSDSVGLVAVGSPLCNLLAVSRREPLRRGVQQIMAACCASEAALIVG